MGNGRVVHRGKMAALAADEALQNRLLGLSLDLPSVSALDAGAALPRRRMDILPALTPVIVALVAAPFIGSLSTFVTLTAAGLAMGMMIFTMASGLTLVFGMMDVLNFGHGAFIALGAYAATLVLLPLANWSSADSVSLNLAVFALAAIVAALMCGAFGWVFERLIVKPVYGQHLEANSRDHRRLDHRRAIALRLVRPGADSARLAEDFRGLVRRRRSGDREISRAGDAGRPHRIHGRDARPNRTRLELRSAPASRTARWSRRSAIASIGCSWLCSWRVRRWRDWAAR